MSPTDGVMKLNVWRCIYELDATSASGVKLGHSIKRPLSRYNASIDDLIGSKRHHLVTQRQRNIDDNDAGLRSVMAQVKRRPKSPVGSGTANTARSDGSKQSAIELAAVRSIAVLAYRRPVDALRSRQAFKWRIAKRASIELAGINNKLEKKTLSVDGFRRNLNR